MTAKETEKSFTKLNGWDNKSRVKGDFQARFCERLGLKCPCLLDRAALLQSEKVEPARPVYQAVYVPSTQNGPRTGDKAGYGAASGRKTRFLVALGRSWQAFFDRLVVYWKGPSQRQRRPWPIEHRFIKLSKPLRGCKPNCRASKKSL
jgi:hypothetical protein